MTAAEELVTAAADAVVAEWALFRAPRSGGTELVRSEYEEVVRTAVAAVLRALATSDKAITAGGYALMQAEGADHPDLNFSLALRKDEARVVLAALAKLADDE